MDNDAFSLKEYECLRAEIVWLLKDYRVLERNALIAVAISWAWLFENSDLPRWAWFLPVLFVGLGALRASGIFKQFGVFHEYIAKIEEAFSRNKDLDGWEHFSWERTGWVSASATVFWVILLLSAGAIAFYEWCHAAK
jgi:hypothetical protein